VYNDVTKCVCVYVCSGPGVGGTGTGLPGAVNVYSLAITGIVVIIAGSDSPVYDGVVFVLCVRLWHSSDWCTRTGPWWGWTWRESSKTWKSSSAG